MTDKFDLKKLTAEAAAEEAAPVNPNVGEWPNGLHRRVKAAAANAGVTLQEFVRNTLAEKVNWKP